MYTTCLPLAREFILRNARLLERRLFETLFDGRDRQGVLAALRAYQNPDGGFAYGLEADQRTAASQPVPLEQALKVLDLVGGFDDPMVAQACDYLLTITTPEGGVPFAVAGVEDAPHTPWWEPSTQANINPTASILGLLLKHGIRHPWIPMATRYCQNAIDTFDGCHYHDVIPVVTFLEHAPDRAWAETRLRRILERLPGSGEITFDPKAEGYVKYPLDWAPLPSSPLRSLFSPAVIERDLQFLAARQQPDGGWPINWQGVGPGAEIEWRGWVTIQSLLTLKENR